MYNTLNNNNSNTLDNNNSNTLDKQKVNQIETILTNIAYKLSQENINRNTQTELIMNVFQIREIMNIQISN